MYIQIDGGAENANSTLLGWLQLLVAKKLVPEILLTRLPVGHTHDDIDALFGHIWSSYRLNPCLTLSDYAEVVRRCFSGNSKINVHIEDVNVIPDYYTFLQPHNDKITRWAKEDLSVHQVHIYAVDEDILSPLGYRMRYRDFCSDRVILLRKCSKIESVTSIGQLTGLEPFTHHAKWFPEQQNDVGQLGDGIYTLRRIPFADPDKGITPVDFSSKNIENLWTTRAAIVNHTMFPEKSKKREEWTDWYTSTIPEIGAVNAGVYIQSHPYHQPLKDFLSNKKQPKQQPMPNIVWDVTPDSNSYKCDIQWPEEVYSFSTPHVTIPEWKSAVINPRIFKYQSECAQQLVKSFQTSTLAYYVRIEKSTVIPQLHAMLRRRLNAQGKHEPLNGNKEELIKRIAQGDFMKYAKMYGGIREKSKKQNLDAHWEIDPASHIDNKSQQHKLVRGMRDGQMESMSEGVFIKILDLLSDRDESMRKANDSYNDCSVTKNINAAFKRSYFFHPEASLKMFVLEMFEHGSIENLRRILRNNLSYRAYFPIRSIKSLIILSVVDREFLFYNADNKLSIPDIVQMGNEYFDSFKTNILCGAENIQEPIQWKLICHKNCVNWERCGDIALLAIILHVSNDLPIFFEKEYMQNLYEVFALSIIENCLYC